MSSPRRGPVALLTLVAMLSTVWVAHASALGWTAGPSTELAGHNGYPTLAMDRSGVTTQVFTESGYRIVAYRLDRFGSMGAGITVGTGRIPAIAATDSGSVVVWQETSGTRAIKLARLDALGAVVSTVTISPESAVNTTVGLAVLPSGDAVVTWGDNSGAAGEQHLHARKITADDTLRPVVDLEAIGGTATVAVTLAPSGHAWVVWLAAGDDLPEDRPSNHYVARLAPNGTEDAIAPIGALDHPPQLELRSSDNGAVLTWRGEDDGTYSYHARRLHSAGSVLGSPMTIASSLRSPIVSNTASVAPNGEVTFFITRFASWVVGGRLMVRRLSAGDVLTAEAPVSGPAEANRSPFLPTVVRGANGALIAIWQDIENSMSDGAVHRLESRVIAADGTPSGSVVPLPALPFSAGWPLYASSSGTGTGTIGTAFHTYGPVDTVSFHSAFFSTEPSGITASIPTTAVRGTEVTFSTTAPDPAMIASAEWQFGNGVGASGTTVSHTYARTGTYEVTVKVTDRFGGVTDVDQSIQVVEPVTPPGPETPTNPGDGGGANAGSTGTGSGSPGTTGGPGTAGPGADRAASVPLVAKSSPKLKIVKATRTAKQVTVRGTILKIATGKLTVTWAQKVGRKTVKHTAKATIKNGAFRATIRLRGTLATATSPGKLTVRYPGNAQLAPATVSRSIAPPKRAKR